MPHVLTEVTVISFFIFINCDNVHLPVGVDIFFLIFAATVMFFMQAGFAMLCAGSVQAKNLQNTLMKNIIDACGK